MDSGKGQLRKMHELTNIKVVTPMYNKNKSNRIDGFLNDRFIPCSVSPQLKFELNESPTKDLEIQRFRTTNRISLKSKSNYQKALLNDLIESSVSPTKSDQESSRGKYRQNLSNSKRKINFTATENKSRKSSPSPMKNIDNDFQFSSKKKKIPTVKPLKVIPYSFPIDNFYYNALDMYDISKVALGTRLGVFLYNLSGTHDTMKPVDISGDEPLCIKFLTDHHLCYSTQDSGIIWFYDLIGLQAMPLLNTNTEASVLTMDMSCCPNIIYFGTETGNVKSLDIRINYINQRNVNILYSHALNNEVCKVKYCTGSDLLISGGNDNTGVVYDLRAGRVAKIFKHNAAIKGIAVSNDKFASGGGTHDKMIKLWDIKKFEQISETQVDSQVTNLEFINKDDLLASYGYIGNDMAMYHLNFDLLIKEEIREEKLRNLDTEDYIIDIFEETLRFEKHGKRILFTSKDVNNEYVATASNDECMKIWKIGKYVHKAGTNNIGKGFFDNLR